MSGLFLDVWHKSWTELWVPLIDDPDGNLTNPVPVDVFCELYRELAKALRIPPSAQALADIIDDAVQSKEAFQATKQAELKGEAELVRFFEAVHEILRDLGGDELSNQYFALLDQLIYGFNLRYELRVPCVLCPTIAGIFTMLVQELHVATGGDSHLVTLMNDFENSIRDLRHDTSDGRIRTCIQKQFNLLEAVARSQPGVTKSTLGAICDQLSSWPHEKLKESMKTLYGFASDYPGIRHGGTPLSAIRPVDMRDLIAVSVVLIGFTPYLENRIRPMDVYGGAPTIPRPLPMLGSMNGPQVVSEGRLQKIKRLSGELVKAIIKG